MADYHYTECGLDNVVIAGVSFAKDDTGEAVVSIPNINGLHRAIALGIIKRKGAMSGSELRFLRSEMGMTQAELAALIHREPLAVSRWERDEFKKDSNAETIIRLIAAEKLGLPMDEPMSEISGWSIPRAVEAPIRIDGSNPDNYLVAA
jgi:DNA-binding transcriptional regulator YiaG